MAPSIKLGLNIVFIKPDCMVRVAKAAEDLGFSSIWMGEHIALPNTDDWWKSYPSYGPGVTREMMTFDQDSFWLDPLIVFAHLAAVTTKVRFGVGIYMLTLRQPLIVGRTLATLDVMSGGRLDLAVGLGWSREEYALAGARWEDRGKRTNEMIACLRALFEQEHPEFHGDFFDFNPIGFQPKPIQKPLPIHIGGSGPAGVKRAAAMGDGWYGTSKLIPDVKAALAEAGRDATDFPFSSTLPGTTDRQTNLDNLKRMQDEGVTQAVISPWPRHQVLGLEAIDVMEAYAQQVGL